LESSTLPPFMISFQSYPMQRHLRSYRMSLNNFSNYYNSWCSGKHFWFDSESAWFQLRKTHDRIFPSGKHDTLPMQRRKAR